MGSPEDGRNPCPSVASGLGSVGVLGIQPFVVELNVPEELEEPGAAPTPRRQASG